MFRIEQTDMRLHEMRKRVKKAFEEQKEEMKIRALRRHGPNCNDVLFCTASNCFQWEPDKIVSEPYEV